ncbi:hypothetical protein MKW98_009119 [Papaver atlanticum]|uniref:Uncharacterized protein n=1 Tax=Papaver atlanticum TaxID=357466 RepID=A0AAD4T833_9MAGN|nr:hypothetical protein MKW98_009119 [Papaver atlanticum]
MSDKSFKEILQLMRESFPEGCTLPENFTQCKKILSELGLSYNKIDACPNDCMLSYKETADLEACTQIFAYPEVLEHWVLTKVNDGWRDHKHHVKKAAYEKWKNEICNVNKQNREKQNFHHTTGSKPHAKCAAEDGVLNVTRFLKLPILKKKKKTEDPDEVLMDPEVSAELKAMEEVEIQASQPGSGIKPLKYWGEGSSTKPTTEPNAEILNLRQQLENTLAELQAATQWIAELEALLVAHDEPGTTNTAYQAPLDRIAELEALLR